MLPDGYVHWIAAPITSLVEFAGKPWLKIPSGADPERMVDVSVPVAVEYDDRHLEPIRHVVEVQAAGQRAISTAHMELALAAGGHAHGTHVADRLRGGRPSECRSWWCRIAR